MKSWIGIDPGKSGGLVKISRNQICLTAMPKTEKDIFEWFTGTLDNPVAIIEKVHAMPGQGVTSMFTFGMGYGGLRMALIACQIPFEEITPRTWQKAFGIIPRKKTETKTQFKNRLKAKAQQLFPKENITLATCDALLIALFCQRKSEGKL